MPVQNIRDGRGVLEGSCLYVFSISMDGNGFVGVVGGVVFVDPLKEWIGAREAAVVKYLRETQQNAGVAVRLCIDPVDEIRSGRMQLLLRNCLAGVREEILWIVAEQRG